MKKSSSAWKYVLILAATGAVAAVGGKVSQCVVDSMHASTQIPPMEPAKADAVARQILEMKCADCHAQDASYSKFWNFFSFGLLSDHVDGAKRAFTLTPDYSVRSGNVDYLKMDYVLRTRRMPPASYSAVHLGSRLTPTDVAILRQKYKEQGAEARAFAPIAAPAAPQTDLEKARIYLGYKLYHDGRLSTNNLVSCSSCHELTKGGTDNLSKSEGVPGPDGHPQLGGVNAPTTFNAAGNIRQFWDGRAADLKEQAGGPPLNPVEMGYACEA
ncbi:MAG: cytochrome c peroxidase, partial [Akkermansia sp.]|nr:cytochrome c peroxidase [Akkermansia sp.]